MQRKIKWGYINAFNKQRLLGELRKGKVFREVKLKDEFLKYKQGGVFEPQGELMLLVLKEKHNSPIASHKRKKPP